LITKSLNKQIVLRPHQCVLNFTWGAEDVEQLEMIWRTNTQGLAPELDRIRLDRASILETLGEEDALQFEQLLVRIYEENV
jgi:hypothetical protein